MTSAVKKAVLLITGLAAGIVLSEAVFWCFPRFRFDACATMVRRLRSDETWACHFRKSSILGYEYIPNVAPGINAFGMCDKEYQQQKPADTFRIFLLGDSITHMATWPDLVEDELCREGKYEVLNAALPGWSLYQYWAYTTKKIKPFQADMLLLGVCLNDIPQQAVLVLANEPLTNKIAAFNVDGPNMTDPELTLQINPYLYRYSSLYRMIIPRLIASFRRPIADQGLAATMLKLREMKSVMQGRVAAIVFPYLKPLETYDERERADYRDTLAVLHAEGIPLLDLTPEFNRHHGDITRYRFNPADPVHYNTEGERIVHGAVQPWLKELIARIRDKGML